MASDMTDVLRDRARASLPPVDGELKLGGLRDPAEVIRDRWGVPHIYARNTHDLFFAASYVVTSERLFQQEFMLRLANGRLAEMLADLALPLDRFFRTVGLNRAGRRIAAGYDDLSREIVQASIEGANAWIETMPAKPLEYEILALDPEPLPTGEEGAAYGTAFAVFMDWSLSNNWDAELLRSEIADRLGWQTMCQLFPEVATEHAIVIAGKEGGPRAREGALDILRNAPLPPSGLGSNNWVVAGSRAVGGKPLLANDPHLFATLPSVWYEAHLCAPGIDVSGVTLPLLVGIQIGHTARIAWGFTAVSGDNQDLYLEVLNQERTAALYDGNWEPLTVHREVIRVRGRDDPETVEVLETRHGPIIDSYMVGVSAPSVIEGGVKHTYALRWAGFEASVEPSVMYRMATAADAGAFREALRGWTGPGLNCVYADVDGNIAYQCTGSYPIRNDGDGTLPVPGWTDQYEWNGFIPFDQLPWCLNPDEGLLATANQKIHDDSYPYLIGKDFMPPFRVRRIVQLLTATEKHSTATFARIQSDTVSLSAWANLPFLLSVEPSTDRQKEALALLSAWDGDMAADSAAAAVYQVWCHRIAEAILRPKLGPELFVHYYARRQWTMAFQYQVLPGILEFPSATWFGRNGMDARDGVLRQALDAALEDMTAAMGEDATGWEWGRLHRVRFIGTLGAVLPDLAELFTGGEAPWGGDEQTICQGMYEPGSGYDVVVVPSWRQIIDLSNIDASIGTHTVGQSGNPASPHFKDLFPLWSRGEYHPLPFSRRAVEGLAESRLALVPG